MSLILDALRKLEREKTAQEPGVLVVGSVPWGERSWKGRLLLAGGALVVVVGAVLAGWLLRSGAPAQSPAQTVAPHATPQPQASPSAAAIATPPPEFAPPARQADPPAPPIRLSHPLPAGRAPDVERTPPPAREESVPAESAAHPVAPDLPTPAPPAPSAAPAGGGELRLSAISQRGGKPVALINDRLVFEGDSFDGVRVLRIGETEVEVEVKGQKRILRF